MPETVLVYCRQCGNRFGPHAPSKSRERGFCWKCPEKIDRFDKKTGERLGGSPVMKRSGWEIDSNQDL